jgi:tRNA/tmRNA/rRNA uracil-C5-methylase (TrmA/RlmC/RlmD family)
VCIWDLELIYWKSTIIENLQWLSFNISPTSFFQTNSAGADKLYSIVLDFSKKNPPVINDIHLYKKEKSEDLKFNNMVVLDLYSWTGTIWMIFAKHWAKSVTSVEVVDSASKDWEQNAKLNLIENMTFVNAKVEDFLDKYLSEWKTADLLVIDPPRTWMHPNALLNILKFWTKQIIYVSCDPSTLSRDLNYILDNSQYKIEKIQAMDMFPHTHHIETIVSLVK